MKAEIFSLDKSNEHELIAFLNRVSAVNHSVLGYHYPQYLKILEKIEVGKLHLIAVKNESNQWMAFLPGMIKTTSIGTAYSSLPFFGPNAGIIADPVDLAEDELIQMTFDFLKSSLSELDIVSTSIYSPLDDFKAQASYEKALRPDEVVEKFTSFIRLDHLQLSTSLLYDLRKAEKSGVEIRVGNFEGAAEQIFSIYKKNCEDYGIPLKPKECIQELVIQSQPDSFTETYTAWLDGKMIGALIMIYSPCTASYYLPCSLHEYRSFQPTTLLIKYAMDRSKERGMRIWNWESSPSKDSGVFKFKMKWGSEDGTYKIFINTYKPREFFGELGQSSISSEFPFFFVFPFNRL